MAAFRSDRGRGFAALGEALLAMSKPEEALTIGIGGLRADPRSRAGRIMVSRALMMLDRYEDAGEQLCWVASDAPRDVEAHRLLGEVLLHQGRYKEALRALERAQWLDPADPGLLLLVERARAHGAPFGLPVRRRLDTRQEAETTRDLGGAEARQDPTLVDEPPSNPTEVEVVPQIERTRPRRRRGRILRFAGAERLLHWSIALPFVVCFITALLFVFYYNPDPTRPHRELVSWVHRVAGICFVVLPLLALLFGVRRWRVHWENIKEGWVWTRADFKWLALMPVAAITRRVSLPEEGKFNAGEKLNFMWTMASYPLYALTGLAIWFGNSYSILPWLAHFALAAISTPLIAGHIFMAVINPSSRKGLSGMFTGFVDRTWAKHHYRRWFREKFGEVRAETGSVILTVGRRLSPALIAAVVFGIGLSAATAYKVLSGSGHDRGTTAVARFLAGKSPLWAGPSDEAAPLPGGPLVQGESVSLIRDAGEFSLVGDARGRQGFVYSTDLFAERPRFDPRAFSTDECRRAEEEEDARGCRARAEVKLTLCQLDCPDGAGGDCSTSCEAQQRGCLDVCEVESVAQQDERPVRGVKNAGGGSRGR